MNSRTKPVNPPVRTAPATAAPAEPSSSDTKHAADDVTPTRARNNNHFRKNRTPLARDDAKRQGDISQLAFLTMGGRDPAVEFLNSENSALGGRPLALATASAEGFEQVAAAIRALAPGAPTS
ncbi:MAG: antitoxin Xre/MbcA/ParS toxin-binding domain-containing protein [Sphingopyxis solisilvae]|uniref:antitoxin Xre/MbcA/ParS toxin-binding domain-containing protein n=1 Tax=Sphingopyxis solisilvae TaxID=1886788 RepID=UPI0040362964